MTTELALSYSASPTQERYRYAQVIADSGALVPKGLRDPNGDPNASRVMYAMEMGAALGFHPIVAVSNIHIIEGKVTLSADLMTACVRKAHHRLRVWEEGSGKTLKAIATIHRQEDPEFEYRAVWTIDKAGTAGLLGKQVWKNYPGAMLRSRAVSEVCKMAATDVLFGAYTPEELGAEVDELGNVVSLPAEENVEDAVVVDDLKPASPQTRLSPEDTQAVADEWAERATRTTTVKDARDLFKEAHQRRLDQYTTTGGELLRDILTARGKALKAEAEQAAEESPLLVGAVMLDDDVEAPY